MAYSDAQKVDLLYKKLFGVAKTDTSANKGASNEANSSPILIRLDNTWISVYPTWQTQLTDWIPPEFGSGYFIKVYSDNVAVGNVVATGTNLSDSGIAGVGEWFFDYQAGILNFVGSTPIPAALTSSKVIYITGYRYIGEKGLVTVNGGSF